MMDMLKNWFKNRFGLDQRPPRATGSYRQRMADASQKAGQPARERIEPAHESMGPAHEDLDLEPRLHGSIESLGPGKNVFIRSQRATTGTDESLEIVGESSSESRDEDGVDPYNTGRFDRPKKWDSRSKK